MEKLDLYDLCVIAKSLFVDFSKLTYQKDGVSYLPGSAGDVKADLSLFDSSQAEYQKIYILISVLQEIYKYRPLPF